MRACGMFGVVALVSLLLTACAGATTPAAPTGAPAASPAKVVEPTKAAAEPAKPAAQPTAVPAKKVDFPAAGKTMNLIVAYNAGSASDIAARLLQPYLEKELGIPVVVVNKPGAGAQVGIQELALAKPDGYTIGYTPLPNMVTLIEDPERKAAFTRKSFQPLAMDHWIPQTVATLATSRYKTIKDVVDDAKARPKKVRYGLTGVLANPHLNMLQLEQVAGVQFAPVHFDAGSGNMTAMLGGNLDVRGGEPADYLAIAEQIRTLAVVGDEELPYFPGVKTIAAQGYAVSGNTIRGICMPAGAPKEIVDTLASALERAINNEDHKKRLLDSSWVPRYGNPAAFATAWDEYEQRVRPLMALAKRD